MSDNIVKLNNQKHITKELDAAFNGLSKLLGDNLKRSNFDAAIKPILESFVGKENPKRNDLIKLALDKLSELELIPDHKGTLVNELGKSKVAQLGEKIIGSIVDYKKEAENVLKDAWSKDPWIIKTAKKLSSGLNQQLAIVTGIMIFRPLIMLTDKAVPMKTRQYAATREFFTELFGLITVLVAGRAIERGFTQWHYNKAIDKLEADGRATKLGLEKVNFLRGVLDPLGWFKPGKEAQKLVDWLQETDFSKLPAEELKMPKGVKGVFGGLVAVIVACAILTPFLNNIVINDKVLNGIWRFLGQGDVAHSNAKHGGAPKLDTPNAAAERMLALMKQTNPARSLNMYQNSQYIPYAPNFSGLQRAHQPNPLARV